MHQLVPPVADHQIDSWILGYAGHVVIEEPAALRHHIAKQAAAIAARCAGA